MRHQNSIEKHDKADNEDNNAEENSVIRKSSPQTGYLKDGTSKRTLPSNNQSITTFFLPTNLSNWIFMLLTIQKKNSTSLWLFLWTCFHRKIESNLSLVIDVVRYEVRCLWTWTIRYTLVHWFILLSVVLDQVRVGVRKIVLCALSWDKRFTEVEGYLFWLLSFS